MAGGTLWPMRCTNNIVAEDFDSKQRSEPIAHLPQECGCAVIAFQNTFVKSLQAMTAWIEFSKKNRAEVPGCVPNLETFHLSNPTRSFGEIIIYIVNN